MIVEASSHAIVCLILKIKKDVKIYEIDHIGACLCDHEYGVPSINSNFMWKVILKAKSRDFKFCLVGSWQFCCVLFCFVLEIVKSSNKVKLPSSIGKLLPALRYDDSYSYHNTFLLGHSNEIGHFNVVRSSAVRSSDLHFVRPIGQSPAKMTTEKTTETTTMTETTTETTTAKPECHRFTAITLKRLLK